MIEWIEYKKDDTSIPSHTDHLVFEIEEDGAVKTVFVAQRFITVKRYYAWHIWLGSARWVELTGNVTHWAKINRPLEDGRDG